jgi:hypothetical protein
MLRQCAGQQCCIHALQAEVVDVAVGLVHNLLRGSPSTHIIWVPCNAACMLQSDHMGAMQR